MQTTLKNIKEVILPILVGMLLGGSILYGIHIFKNFEIKVSRRPEVTSQQFRFSKPPIIEFNGERFAILAINDHKTPKFSSIVVKNLRDQKISTSRIGETAFKTAKVTKITRNYITLEDAQRSIVISLPESTPNGNLLNRIM